MYKNCRFSKIWRLKLQKKNKGTNIENQELKGDHNWNLERKKKDENLKTTNENIIHLL